MKIKDFILKDNNHFVAMEYHRLISNRTFLVLLTNQHLIGLKVNGFVSVEIHNDPQMAALFNHKAIKGDLHDPYNYIKSSFFEKFAHMSIYNDRILTVDRANFKIRRQDILKTTYNQRQKWTMGYYPHDGTVYLKATRFRRRKFIILGNQSAADIAGWIHQFTQRF